MKCFKFNKVSRQCWSIDIIVYSRSEQKCRRQTRQQPVAFFNFHNYNVLIHAFLCKIALVVNFDKKRHYKRQRQSFLAANVATVFQNAADKPSVHLLTFLLKLFLAFYSHFQTEISAFTHILGRNWSSLSLCYSAGHYN